jgi:predicted O-methyltransferase YrrM
MNATDKLLELDPHKKILSHKEKYGPVSRDSMLSHSDFQDMQDPTGIAIEEGEFLYGLVRMVKPVSILETGTNIGVSAQYMALALRDNGFGHLTTIEKDGTVASRAKDKLAAMGLSSFATVVTTTTTEFFAGMHPDLTYDFLWLDTELKERYNELLTLFPRVTPGGIICIHDLWCLEHPWYGGVPAQMKQLFKNGDLRGLTFKTDHGVATFQKRRTEDHLADIQRG